MAATSIAPVVQLTVQPARFLLTKDNCLGNVLLRELQRQAVLIAAREELGLRTRDMVLGEPFATHNQNRVTTILCESRIWRGEMAQLCLARFDGKQPADPYALAELQVDQKQNSSPHWPTFKISNDPLTDYPEFVTKCEEASRTSYLQALKDENVLGDFQPNPTKWCGENVPASPAAIANLREMNEFSQYLAVRAIHQQIKASGASINLIEALVRGYANLGQLTSEQWCQDSKAFTARSLLYAQRLVVHEKFSSASLCIRAYAEAMAGLHAAALADLDQAHLGNDGVKPEWLGAVVGLCTYDQKAIDSAITIGPWSCRPLAEYLSAVVALDEYPQAMQQDAIARQIQKYPGLFLLAPFSDLPGDDNTPRPADQVVNQLPVVLSETLRSATLPTTVHAEAAKVAPGDHSYQQIASLRDRLLVVAANESAEPSLGVLANLIVQEEMSGIVHKVVTLKNKGTGNTNLPKVMKDVDPILRVHRWGAYVQALNVDENHDGNAVLKLLKKVNDRDAGGWVESAIGDLNLTDQTSIKFTDAWQTAANLSADSLVDDYNIRVGRAKAINHDLEHYLWLLRKTSPHSAYLLEAWLRQIPIDRQLSETDLYESTLKLVETEFENRPMVLQAAGQWCVARGDFQRSFDLLSKHDRLEPTDDVCQRLAELSVKLGHRDEAISQLMRGVKMSSDPNMVTRLYHEAAYLLIQDRRFTDAMSCIQLSTDVPTAKVWQLMARCYEAMGRFDDADECLRQLAVSDPQCLVQHYLWSKRVGRKDANDIRRKAIAALAGESEASDAKFFLAMGQNQTHQAMSILNQQLGDQCDAFSAAQLLILAKANKDTAAADKAMVLLNEKIVTNTPFAGAFSTLVKCADATAGVKQFDVWASRQLDDEDAMDWYSLAGRYLVARGDVNRGKQCLVRAIRLTQRERQNYFLAWSALQGLGEDPKAILNAQTAARE